MRLINLRLTRVSEWKEVLLRRNQADTERMSERVRLATQPTHQPLNGHSATQQFMRAYFIYAARLLAARGDFETIMWNNPHGALSQNLVNTHPTSHRIAHSLGIPHGAVVKRTNLSQGTVLCFQLFALFSPLFTLNFLLLSWYEYWWWYFFGILQMSGALLHTAVYRLVL